MPLPEFTRRLCLAVDQTRIGGALHPFILEEFPDQRASRLPLWRFGAWAAAQGWTLPDGFPWVAPPESPEPQAAHVEANSASDAPATQGNIMKKAALIAALEHEWKSIHTDISEATRNELKAAAHTKKHGEWDRDKARAWAVSKGKIKQAAPVHGLDSAWSGATTRHTTSG